jgi:hypothetical protein
MAKRRRVRKKVIWVCVSLGLVLLGLAVCAWQYTSLRGREIALGTVVGLIENTDGDGTTYALSIRFADNLGQPHEFTPNFRSSSPGYAVGDSIRVAFNRYAPGDVRVVSFGYRFGVGWILIVLGCAGLAILGGWHAGNAWIARQFPVTVNSGGEPPTGPSFPNP